MNKLQMRLREAMLYCNSLCQGDRQAEQWLRQAFEAAEVGERQHRRGIPNRYKLTVADAARFFTVKWFLDIQAPPKSYADACSLRQDCLYALAARDRVKTDAVKNETWHRLYADMQDIRELDYSREFVK